MACGCPVVSTDCPSGPSEILDGGSFGRLVPVGDYEEMAKAIRETLEQTAAPASLAEHALRFSIDRVIDRCEDLQSVVWGKRVSIRVDTWGRWFDKNKQKKNTKKNE